VSKTKKIRRLRKQLDQQNSAAELQAMQDQLDHLNAQREREQAVLEQASKAIDDLELNRMHWRSLADVFIRTLGRNHMFSRMAIVAGGDVYQERQPYHVGNQVHYQAVPSPVPGNYRCAPDAATARYRELEHCGMQVVTMTMRKDAQLFKPGHEFLQRVTLGDRSFGFAINVTQAALIPRSVLEKEVIDYALRAFDELLQVAQQDIEAGYGKARR